VTDANNCEVVETYNLTRIRQFNTTSANDRDDVLFPNPSHGTIIIFPRQMDLNKIEIFNAFGQLKFEMKDDFTEKIELDLSLYASGMHYVHLRNDEMNVTKKLILAR